MSTTVQTTRSFHKAFERHQVNDIKDHNADTGVQWPSRGDSSTVSQGVRNNVSTYTYTTHQFSNIHPYYKNMQVEDHMLSEIERLGTDLH